MSGALYPRSKAEVDEMIASLDRASKRILRSKKTAREFLIKHGYITKGGRLTKRYGG